MLTTARTEVERTAAADRPRREGTDATYARDGTKLPTADATVATAATDALTENQESFRPTYGPAALRKACVTFSDASPVGPVSLPARTMSGSVPTGTPGRAIGAPKHEQLGEPLPDDEEGIVEVEAMQDDSDASATTTHGLARYLARTEAPLEAESAADSTIVESDPVDCDASEQTCMTIALPHGDAVCVSASPVQHSDNISYMEVQLGEVHINGMVAAGVDTDPALLGRTRASMEAEMQQLLNGPAANLTRARIIRSHLYAMT